MAGVFKKLSANDIKITPFEAHKKYSSTTLSSIGVSTDFVSWAPYNKAYYLDGNRKYSQIDKLYYRDYIRERAYRLELDDATYTTQERRLYDCANVISFPQRNFGNEIQPGTFFMSCSYSSSEEQFNIQDDGFGNLYDVDKGKDNFPNEDYRILYIGPTQAFKRADLTIDYETGKKYVNDPFPNGYTRTVYDDSYFLNEVEYKNVNFITSSNSGFYSIKTSLDITGDTTTKQTKPLDLSALYHSNLITVAPEPGSSLYISAPGNAENLFDGNKTTTTPANTYNIDGGTANDADAFTITFDPPYKTNTAVVRVWSRGTEDGDTLDIYINADPNTSQSFVQNEGLSVEQKTATFNVESTLNSITFSGRDTHSDFPPLPYHQFIEVELDVNPQQASYIKIPHQPQFNFETVDDFTINFYYDLNLRDHVNSTISNDYFILTKEGNKTVASLPSEKTRDISLRISGSSQIKTSPIGNQFPYRIYYKGNHPNNNTASLFFERSDGDVIQSVSSSFFLSGSTDTQKFISCKNDNGELKLTINNQIVSSSEQNSPLLTKTVSNKADITLYNKPNPDGSYSKFIGKNNGQISQLMMWNQTLSETETINISESIVGTPNIGNIFYDNGFAVVTHPSYKNVLNNYDFNGFNSVVSASISSSAGAGFKRPSGGSFNGDGTKLILTSLYSDRTIEFTLNTPYDITSFATSQSFGNFDIALDMNALVFNNDGSKIYAYSTTGTQVVSFSLSSSYDLESRYNKNEVAITTPNSTQVRGMAWSNDGTKFFTTTISGDINQYTSKDPFDLDDILYDCTYNVGHTGAIEGIRFDNSGYRMFIIHTSNTTSSPWGLNKSYITQYVLDRPFDLKSLNIDNRFNSQASIYSYSLPNFLDYPSDILFNGDGTKAYVTIQSDGPGATYTQGGPSDYIWQFDLPQHINRFEYKNTHLITENEYQCTMTEDEFEFTTNPTVRKIPFSDSEDIANFATGSHFKPYVTSVGLYDDDGNLLVVGKLGQPIKASSETDTTFVIRFDT